MVFVWWYGILYGCYGDLYATVLCHLTTVYTVYTEYRIPSINANKRDRIDRLKGRTVQYHHSYPNADIPFHSNASSRCFSALTAASTQWPIDSTTVLT